MSSKAGKRPLRSLTAHEKLEAIRRVHDGESKASVARDIGVPESTLRGWCKNEDKISYLSRQSSPDTDESALAAEPKEKKPKLEEVLQPYNLSKKTNGNAHSPVTDFTKTDFDIGTSKPLNLNVKTECFKSSTAMSERERNRAELARLSVELGLNRPEMFLPNMNSGGSLTDLTSNIGLLAQWNSLIAQHQQKSKSNIKVTAPADTSTSSIGSFSGIGSTPPKVEPEPKPKPPKLPKLEKPASVDESVWYWLKSQPSMLGLMQNQNGLPVSSTSTTPTVTSSTVYNETTPSDQSSSWFWKWYKQFANSYPSQHHLPEKPILYQQLTKDKDGYNSENITMDDNYSLKNNTKVRAVLDNLLFNNNNNNSLGLSKKEDKVLTQSEALEHGEKFLEWLECCSEPSVTAVQIMQFRYLLSNIKNGADRKNSNLQNRAKVKRK